MLKYLNKISERLAELKTGIERNANMWRHTPESPDYVEQLIDEIKCKDKEIVDIRKTLSQKLAEARDLSEEKKNIVNRIEKRAIGIHADDPAKLTEYGIKNGK